ncbi:MAG TPA: hypothetical protein VHE79_16225, partial [Spirochaetia bacterium]
AGGSIFATIEKEQKTGSGTLPDYLTIADITATSTGGPYYIAAGAVFKGTMSSTPASMTWNPNSDSATSDRPYNPTYNESTMLCNALTYWSAKGELYGGFYTSDAEHYGLYSASSSNPVTANWSQLTLPSSGEQVTYLQVAGSDTSSTSTSYLYIGGAVVASSSTYELDYYDGTTVWKSSLGGYTLSTPVKGVAYSSSYGYFVATNDAVYVSSTENFSSATAVTPSIGASPDKIHGIYSDGTNVFVLTERSGIYQYNGSSFSQLVADPQPSSSVYVGFLSMAKIGSVYLVGSNNSYGYYILSGSTLTRYSDTTVGLYVESVSRIYVGADMTVFMGTNANGLWGTQMDSSGNLTTSWTHEQKDSTSYSY